MAIPRRGVVCFTPVGNTIQAMIKLKLWLKGEKGRAKALAKCLRVGSPFITKIANGEKPIPVEKMYQIECFTGQAVTRRDMHPSPELIWPDLATTEKEVS